MEVLRKCHVSIVSSNIVFKSTVLNKQVTIVKTFTKRNITPRADEKFQNVDRSSFVSFVRWAMKLNHIVLGDALNLLVPNSCHYGNVFINASFHVPVLSAVEGVKYQRRQIQDV